MHSTVSIGLAALILAFSYLFGQWQIPCGYIHFWHISVISTSGYLKEPAHFANWIFLFVMVDHHIFYACSHFLSVSERKSRINSFSISKRLMYLSLLESSYCNCETLFICCTDGGNSVGSFLGLPFGLIGIPDASFCCFLLCLFVTLCTCSGLRFNFSLFLFVLIPWLLILISPFHIFLDVYTF